MKINYEVNNSGVGLENNKRIFFYMGFLGMVFLGGRIEVEICRCEGVS